MQTKILIAVPSGDQIHADTSWCITHNAMVLGSEGIHVAILNMRSANLPSSRQHLAEQAILYGCTHLMFIDSDMVLPADAFLTLLKHKKDIVGTYAVKRHFPITTIGTKWDGSRFSKEDTGLKTCKTLGTGVMLIKTSVFADIPKPWFMLEYDEAKAPQPWVSEDIYFCQKAIEQGFKIYCDCDLSKEVGHIGSHTYKVTDG